LVGKLNRFEVATQKKTEDSGEEQRSSNPDEKKKRTRRTAGEIPRNFRCSVEKCQKLYG
jgi:hypothetical protein